MTLSWLAVGIFALLGVACLILVMDASYRQGKDDENNRWMEWYRAKLAEERADEVKILAERRKWAAEMRARDMQEPNSGEYPDQSA